MWPRVRRPKWFVWQIYISSAKRFKIRSLGRLNAPKPIHASDQVLELEPWDPTRHVSKVGVAWAECGRRVPGYLKGGGRAEPRQLVQLQVTRMGCQLLDPTAKPPWESYTEVVRRVEEVVAKMSATRRHRDKFGLHQQQGAVEPDNSNPGTVEMTHASPEQPATAQQQRQQQGHEELGTSFHVATCPSFLRSRGGKGVCVCHGSIAC